MTDPDEILELAPQIVDTIRAQNWKNGGVLAIDRGDAISVVEQAIRSSYAAGVAAGAKEIGQSMLQAFDAAASTHKTAP